MFLWIWLDSLLTLDYFRKWFVVGVHNQEFFDPSARQKSQ